MAKTLRCGVMLALVAMLTVGTATPSESQTRQARLRERLPDRVQAVRAPRLRNAQVRMLWRARLEQRAVRRARQAERLRRYRAFLEQLRNGDLVVQGEILATDASDVAIARAQGLGFLVVRDRVIEGLGQRLTVLRAAQGLGVEQALASLRAADPEGDYDYNHVMEEAAASAMPSGLVSSTDTAAAPPTRVRIGLIDTGVDRDAPPLKSAHVITKGFTQGEAVTGDAHGTAIASMLVGSDPKLKALLPGATLYAADVYGTDDPDGGSSEAVIKALAWMVRENVPVINISLVGPPNRALEKAIATLSARGFTIVASVGNDGPSAPPLYPAAYPHVVGVTGVDRKQKVLLEANQGDQVDFAARGADVMVSTPDGELVKVRGTSFAAPVIAARLALEQAGPSPQQGSASLAGLRSRAIDLGPRGRDPIYGDGLVDGAQIASR